MRQFVLFAVIFFLAVPAAAQQAEFPLSIRQPNYSPHGEGSCVHASTVTLLRWAGEDEWADWWRKTYNSGENAYGLIEKLKKSGLPFSYTAKGDVAFLEWATRNRHGAGIFYFKKHAVNIVGLDSKYAYLIDNNYPIWIIEIEREKFISNWQNKYGGFAWTFVLAPAPPYPIHQK